MSQSIFIMCLSETTEHFIEQFSVPPGFWGLFWGIVAAWNVWFHGSFSKRLWCMLMMFLGIFFPPMKLWGQVKIAKISYDSFFFFFNVQFIKNQRQLVLGWIKLHSVLSVLSNLTEKRLRITKVLTKYALFINEEVCLGGIQQRSKILLELRLSQNKITKHKTAQSFIHFNNTDKLCIIFSSCNKIKKNKIKTKTKLDWIIKLWVTCMRCFQGGDWDCLLHKNIILVSLQILTVGKSSLGKVNTVHTENKICTFVCICICVYLY